jgi:hypothetical protein
VILAISALTVWRRVKPRLIGMSYTVFITIALIMPSYCIWYAWAYLLVLYFAALNYMSCPDVKKKEKAVMRFALAILLASSYSIAIGPLNYISVMFWGTLCYFCCASWVIIRNLRIR